MIIAYYRGTPVRFPGAGRALIRRVGPPYAPPGEEKIVVTPDVIGVDHKTGAVRCRGITYLPEKAKS